MGDTREDGMVFYCKKPTVTGFYEWWVTKEHFKRIVEKSLARGRLKYNTDPVHHAKCRARNMTETKRAAKRAWNKANRTYLSDYMSARRAKEQGNYAELSDADKKRVREWYAFRTLLNRVHKKAVFHVDHKIPISRGGVHHPDNLRVTTAAYNVRKFTKIEALP